MRLGLAIAVAYVLLGCSAKPATGVHGDADRGRLLLRQFGCGACHEIPGVASAEGRVGPSLAEIGRRVYLAGVLPNSPENLSRWIRAPGQIKPQTTMPDMQVSEAQALDMVAYLYGSKR